MNPIPLIIFSLITLTAAHGFMNQPAIRGSLVKSVFVLTTLDPNAPRDHWAHFPAGNRDSEPGSGLRSQIQEAGPKGWTPFTPLDPNFKWRAGVCGDEKIPGKKQAHLKGGQYYYGGKITATYRQAGIIDVALSIIAHHNGFMELHVCDIQKCQGGDISESCFRKGHCQQLERASNKQCDSGMSKKCAPIDRNYPGRWYFPCTTVGEDGWEIFGGSTIKYRLPQNLACEHCVLQWFWTAANTCNPPGVVEYFDGPDAPKNWGNCKGQGGALGGVTRVQRPCGEDRFPEEYLDCADIRILPRTPDMVEGLSNEAMPSPTPAQVAPNMPSSSDPSPMSSYSKSPKPSPKPSVSKTPRPSSKPSQSKTPRPSPKPSRSQTPRPSPKPSRSSTPRPSPKSSRSSTPRLSPKPSRSSKPRPSPKKKAKRSENTVPEPSPSASPSVSPVSALDLDLSEPMEPSFSPGASPEESYSPEPEWSPEPSSDDYEMNPFEPNPRNGAIKDIVLVADGKDISSVQNGDLIDISPYEKIALKVVTTRKVHKVDFYINGDKVWTEHHMEYYIFGNTETTPYYWKNPPLNVWIELLIVAEKDEDVMNIMFTK